jgi:sialic acid synthase SpsE
MQKEIKIGNKILGEGHPPFIIAEMSGNHNQSIDRALEIVTEAAKAGADAIKIQTYTADTMTLDISEGEFFIEDETSLWKGNSLYKLYEKAHTPWDWHKAIFDKAAECGIIAFSSPFDETAVDFLEDLNAPCYKIASFECVDIPLIKKVALTGRPVIISTGMANEEEIKEAVNAFKEAGGKDLILLKCTSAYPATVEDANLNTIKICVKNLACRLGYPTILMVRLFRK